MRVSPLSGRKIKSGGPKSGDNGAPPFAMRNHLAPFAERNGKSQHAVLRRNSRRAECAERQVLLHAPRLHHRPIEAATGRRSIKQEYKRYSKFTKDRAMA